MISLYLHIPFCKTKCTYCAFNTYVKLEAWVQPFVDALIHELAIVAASQPGLEIGTVFLGGGTPSMLSPQQFAATLNAVYRYFDVAENAEISLEANPNDLDLAYLTAIHAAGANRLSIGMQSANPAELRLYHRRHDHATTISAVQAARRAGFDNLNLDLIYGAPGQTLVDWANTLRAALALEPDHISLYALGLEEGTQLFSWVEQSYVPQPDDDLAADMYELATQELAAYGYEQYEISNWSRPGFQCRHNLQYWLNEPYLGLGPGANGYAGGVRYSTVLVPQRYIKLIENAEGAYAFPYTPATAEAVVVDTESEIAETLIMGLRLTQQGINRQQFQQRFGVDLVHLHAEKITHFAELGLLDVNPRTVRLTAQGRLLSNVVFRELV